MSASPIAPEILAAKLLGRLIHDALGAASGTVANLDLHAESTSAELREEALAGAADSARAVVDLLAFCRAAYAGAGASLDAAELEALARSRFVGRRASLDWTVEAPGPLGLAGQSLLILSHIAGEALAAGGTATASLARRDGREWATVKAAGPRVIMHPETLDGFAGRPLDAGLAGRWAPARYLHALVAASGGAVRVEPTDGRINFTVELDPAV